MDSQLAPAAAELFGGAVTVQDGRVAVVREEALASEHMDALARQAVFGDDREREWARWVIWEVGQQVGVRPASIHDLYMARGRGERAASPVPAINVRAATYDTARAIFRTAIRLDAGAFILEIARSEIAYTEQRPAEYVSVLLAAALREGFRGPVFVQGDHFQVNAKKFAVDPVTEVNAVKQLAVEAIHAGFYNIDVDTSTLVDLKQPDLDAQQRLNYETAVELTRYVRSLEPAGVTISIGGEIGEVGTENSTPEELRAFMTASTACCRRRRRAWPGCRRSACRAARRTAAWCSPTARSPTSRSTSRRCAAGEIARDEYGLSGACSTARRRSPTRPFNTSRRPRRPRSTSRRTSRT
jgi:hypothetical protein